MRKKERKKEFKKKERKKKKERTIFKGLFSEHTLV